MKTLLEAHAHSVGGRGGHTGTTDGKLSFELIMPGMPAKEGTTTNPEELFACGYAACFGGALDFIAKQKKIAVGTVDVKSDVSLLLGDDGPSLAVSLNVSVEGLSQGDAEALVRETHGFCPYSRATRGNIPVSLHVNGHALQ